MSDAAPHQSGRSSTSPRLGRIAAHFRHPYISLLALVSGLLVVGESVYWLSVQPLTAFEAGSFIIETACLIWFIVKPTSGAFALIIETVIAVLTPSITTPALQLFASLVAVAAMSFLYAIPAAITGVVFAGSLFLSALTEPNSIMGNGGAFSFSLFILVAYAIGFILAQDQQHRREQAKSANLHEKALIAQRLHDYTTNGLSDIIMLSDQAAEIADREQLDNLFATIRSAAVDALDHTRRAIVILEEGTMSHSRQSNSMSTSSASMPPLATDEFGNTLSELIDRQEEMLSAIGLRGTVLITGSFTHIDMASQTLISGIVRELFGNIARHASPSEGYAMTIGMQHHQCSIQVSDVPAQGEKNGQGLGTGLQRYHQAIEHRHGEWDIKSSPDHWSFMAIFPIDRS
jgi:signal transduction histidine kinase